MSRWAGNFFCECGNRATRQHMQAFICERCYWCETHGMRGGPVGQVVGGDTPSEFQRRREAHERAETEPFRELVEA